MIQSQGNGIYIGLMSGTSLDGIDVAIVDFADFPPRLLHTSTTPYAESMRQRLHDLCHAETTTLEILFGLDAELGELYAETVNQALKLASLDHQKIVAIGCHGQTIRHSPDSPTAFTAQIGDPNRVATITGISTVADFRRKDIALGGQAAPLAPAFHQFLFHSDAENRVLINIGGIANITYLPADPAQAVLGFDTGPGNTLLNYWNEKHRQSPFDDTGAWARSGQAIDGLLEKMLAGESYFRLAPPKSTGTEYFDSKWLTRYLTDNYAPNDVQATLVELTASTIADALSGLPEMPANCFVCGGGAHNQYLLERLAHKLPQCGVETTSSLGLDPDFVEAVAFAWLARERMDLRSGNIAEVTRARRAAVLGGIYAPD